MSAEDFEVLAQDLTPRYALGPLLGKGAFGAVHRARDVAAGREVAIKLLSAERGGATAMQRFLREAATVARLEHPGVIKVHGAGRHGGRPAIVYELVEGTTFSEAARTLSLPARVELVRDAARAVGHAHALGVVHRDLKPDNLLVGRDGRLRVADFGLALFEGADRLTRTGAFVGTPFYMAPERFRLQGGPVDGPAADVWALGVILYEALTGRLPFEDQDFVALVALLEHAKVTPPRRIDRSIHPAVEAVCLRALQRAPGRRYPDGEALAAALDDALAGRLPPGHTRARRLAVAPGSLGLATALALLAVVALRGRSAPAGPTQAGLAEPLPVASPGPDAEPAAQPITDRTLPAGGWAVWVDAARVLTGAPDEHLRLWDAASGEALRTWPRGGSSAARFGPGKMIVGTESGLNLLAVDHDEPPSSLGRFVAVQQVARASTSGHVAVIARAADDPGWAVHVLSPDGGRRRAPLDQDEATPSAVALAPDGALLTVCTLTSTRGGAVSAGELGRAGLVLLFGLQGAATLRRSVTVPGHGLAAQMIPEGDDLVVVGSSEGQVGVISRSAGAVVEYFHDTRRSAHEGAVRGLAITPDGRRLFSLADHPGRGLELKEWSYRTRQQVGAPFVAPGQPVSLELSPDGRALVIGTVGGGAHVRVVRGGD